MGIGFSELMVILIIIMIIFGAGKLPEIGSAFGRSIRNFKVSMKEAEEADKLDQTAATQPGNPAQQTQAVDDPNLSKEEKEKLAREKLQVELGARDKQREHDAAMFTASLPKSGSYDFAKDQEKKV